MQSEADLKMTRTMNSRFEKVSSKVETYEKEAQKKFDHINSHLIVPDVEFTENATFPKLGLLIQDMLNRTENNF